MTVTIYGLLINSHKIITLLRLELKFKNSEQYSLNVNFILFLCNGTCSGNDAEKSFKKDD